MEMVTKVTSATPSSSLLPFANRLPWGFKPDSSFHSLRVSLRGSKSQQTNHQHGHKPSHSHSHSHSRSRSRSRRGYSIVARISETEGQQTLEQQEAEQVREDERTGAVGGYKLKESMAPQPVHLEMETVDDGVVRPKRIAFNYGFQAKFLRTGPSVPGSVVRLAFENFGREWRSLRRTILYADLKRIDPSKLSGPVEAVTAYTGRGLFLFLRGLDKFLTLYDGLTELKPLEAKGENLEQDELRAALKKLKLSNQAVWDRENARPPVEAPWWILGPYYLLCLMLDVIFDGRPIQRFWFLETVARMPYFSYISMLHLYETLGWWRIGAEVRKVHFAEEWNEMHHLKIMEALGGDLEWGDRFFGQHAAFFYYWVLNAMFLVSPKVAYNFSELIEMHAVDTYGEFADANEELLKSLPPPPVALAYYEGDDLYMYDEFQTSQPPESRRPKINNLYDVFQAICGDELEHVKTMAACQELNMPVRSPHDRAQMKKEKEVSSK